MSCVGVVCLLWVLCGPGREPSYIRRQTVFQTVYHPGVDLQRKWVCYCGEGLEGTFSGKGRALEEGMWISYGSYKYTGNKGVVSLKHYNIKDRLPYFLVLIWLRRKLGTGRNQTHVSLVFTCRLLPVLELIPTYRPWSFPFPSVNFREGDGNLIIREEYGSVLRGSLPFWRLRETGFCTTLSWTIEMVNDSQMTHGQWQGSWLSNSGSQ